MDSEKFVERARGLAQQHNWTWLEPITAERVTYGTHGTCWKVRSNAQALGCNVEIILRECDGEPVVQKFRRR